MFIVRNRNWFFALSLALVIASFVAIFTWGLSFGTDFTGGSILEVSYSQSRPDLEIVRSVVDGTDVGTVSIRPSGSAGYVLRSQELSLEQKDMLLGALSINGTYELQEERFNTIGPVVGESLKNKSYIAIGLVIVAIVLFIMFAFRRSGEKISSWKYGAATIVALVHDVLIPTGAYVLFSQFTSAEIDLLFLTALLAILGFSVHDTIVVFDRVRENLRTNEEHRVREGFDETVGRSIMDTMARSINTSVTTILALIALFILGSEATRNFVFAMLAGILAGAYSSIFLASPLLVVFAGKGKK